MSDDENDNETEKPKKLGKKQPTGDYAVGYCRTPEHSRFGHGQIGNRKGRHKAEVKTFEKEVNEILDTIIEVRSSNGKIRKITKRKAFLEQIINGGIKCIPTMARLALPLLKLGDETPEFEVLPEDEAVVDNIIMHHLGYADKNEKDNDDEN